MGTTLLVQPYCFGPRSMSLKKSLLATSFTSTFHAATITMLLALITNSLIYKQKINNLGFRFQPETQFRSYTITIRYSIQLVAKEKKRQYTKTLLLIYYYYGKKEIKRQNCCGNFFH